MPEDSENEFSESRHVSPNCANPSRIVVTSAGVRIGSDARVDSPPSADLTVTESSNFPAKNEIRTLTIVDEIYVWSFFRRFLPAWRFSFSLGQRATVRARNSTPILLDMATHET